MDLAINTPLPEEDEEEMDFFGEPSLNFLNAGRWCYKVGYDRR